MKVLTNDITDLTISLVTLFPGNPELEEEQKELCAKEVRASMKILRDLAKAVKGKDKMLATALSGVLRPVVNSIPVLCLI